MCMTYYLYIYRISHTYMGHPYTNGPDMHIGQHKITETYNCETKRCSGKSSGIVLSFQRYFRIERSLVGLRWLVDSSYQ